ncbi:hypothetical protein OTU49_004940 [Cherax quadricarinatus]|uniref:Regulatory protein zeste n=2 Tax=Cherax quadricarinatus TaxID=27406 RepID=A0AAW0X997_CHEQU
MANSLFSGSVSAAVPGNASHGDAFLPNGENCIKEETGNSEVENGVLAEDMIIDIKQEVDLTEVDADEKIKIYEAIVREQSEQYKRITNQESGPLKRRILVKGLSVTSRTNSRRRRRTFSHSVLDKTCYRAQELRRKFKLGSRSSANVRSAFALEMPAPPKCLSRSSPVSQFEKECLLGIVKDFMDIIADKSTSFVATSRKATVWQDVAARFNAATGYSKSSQQVRKIWENMRNRAKKEYIRVMQEQNKTGGPPPIPVDALSCQVLPLIERELEPLENPWDCDSDVHNQSILEESDASDGPVTYAITTPEPLLCLADPSVEPESIAGSSGEPQCHSGPTAERERLMDTLAVPESLDVPSSEPECLVGPSTEPKPPAPPSSEPEGPHESFATVTDDSPAQVVPVQRVRSTRKRKSWSSSRSKEDAYDTALRSADERNKKRMEMDQALHEQQMRLVEMQLAYLEEYHKKQLDILGLQRQYWEKKSKKE